MGQIWCAVKFYLPLNSFHYAGGVCMTSNYDSKLSCSLCYFVYLVIKSLTKGLSLKKCVFPEKYPLHFVVIAIPIRWYQTEELKRYFIYLLGKRDSYFLPVKSTIILNFLCLILHFSPCSVPKIPLSLLDCILEISFLPCVVISLYCVSSIGMEKLLPEVRGEMQACWRRQNMHSPELLDCIWG